MWKVGETAPELYLPGVKRLWILCKVPRTVNWVSLKARCRDSWSSRDLTEHLWFCSNLLAVLDVWSGQMENGHLSRGQTTVIGRKSERSRGRENDRKVQKQCGPLPRKWTVFTQSSNKTQRTRDWMGNLTCSQRQRTKDQSSQVDWWLFSLYIEITRCVCSWRNGSQEQTRAVRQIKKEDQEPPVGDGPRSSPGFGTKC